MSDLFDIERDAQRLERHLASGLSPEVQVLIGLDFFRHLRNNSPLLDPHPYLTQFLSRLAISATKADPEGLFPDEADATAEFAEWIRQIGDAASAEAIAGLAQAAGQFLRGCVGGASSHGSDECGRARTWDEVAGSVAVNCLFVEHFPDLDLPARGRLLKLTVTATTISKKAGTDDVVVRNPVTKPDDRFLAQARDSVKAARSYMHGRYGLPLTKRYRFDFAVEASGARFTGDSLGVAFAVGAIAAIGRIEVLRERLTILPEAAFSGALSPDGGLSVVDSEALRRKINRAFFSRLKYLVIPRDHIIEAWAYLSELETRHPGRKLELVGADTLGAVAGDPRLLPRERLSGLSYTIRRAWKARRVPAVELTVLLASICLLLYLVLPARYMPWFDRNPVRAVFNVANNSVDALNRDSDRIWSEVLLCKLAADQEGLTMAYDLDGDGKNEVLFTPFTSEASGQRDWLYCFSSDHRLLFKRYCAVRGQYPGDTAGVFYDPEWIHVAKVGGKPVIITEVATSSPARSHIRLWDARGDSLGWYINAGGSKFMMAKDLDGDGREELLFLNYNNRMGCTALLVLDLDSTIAGASPPYVDSTWDLSKVKRGNQSGYLLFPVTDLGREDLQNRYNEPGPEGIREEKQAILQVYVSESHTGYACAIYSLNSFLRIVGVTFTDQFLKQRSDLVSAGRLPSVNWGQYADHARDSVLYWRAGAWVTEGQLRTQSLP